MLLFQNLKTPTPFPYQLKDFFRHQKLDHLYHDIKESSSFDDSVSLFSYHILILSSISPVVYYVLRTIIPLIIIVLNIYCIQWFLVF